MIGFSGRAVYHYTSLSQANCLAFRDWLETQYPSLTRLDTRYVALTGIIWASVVYAQGWINIFGETSAQKCEIYIRVRKMNPAAVAIKNKLVEQFGLTKIDDVIPWHGDTTQDGEG